MLEVGCSGETNHLFGRDVCCINAVIYPKNDCVDCVFGGEWESGLVLANSDESSHPIFTPCHFVLGDLIL